MINDETLERISIVIPIYNEEESIKPLYQKICTVMAEMEILYELVFVDDGSTDSSFETLLSLYQNEGFIELSEILDKKEIDSWEINNHFFPVTQCVEELHSPQITIIQFRRNVGKAMALQAGFEMAKGDIIITMDADLQDDPNEIPSLLEKIEEGYDLVSGWKYPRKDPFSKRLLSKIFNRTTCLLTGLSIHDINCGFKAFRREVLGDLELYGDMHRYIPVFAHFYGYRVTEVKVKHHPRQFGKSKYGLGRIPRGFFDLLTVLFLHKYLCRPLHFFGSIGVLLTAIGFSINAYLTYLWFFRGGIGHRPLLMLGVLLIVIGIQFLSIGLLGEMFTKVYERFEKSFPVRRILRGIKDL